MHGLWVIALVLYGCLVIGCCLDLGRLSWVGTRRFLAVGVLSLAAASVNPSGPLLLLTPFEVRGYARFVGEWGPPSLLNPFFAATFLLLGIILVGWARLPTRVSYPDIALVLGACLVGLPYIRTMPVAAIAPAPVRRGDHPTSCEAGKRVPSCR